MDEQGPEAGSRLRVLFVAVLVLVVGAHLLLVTAAALPPNRYSEAVRPGTTYLSPFFTQNWRLFAPRPVSADRTLSFQGAYVVDGELRTTEWVDWTDVELDLVRHQLVGGRAGYVTNKMYSPLSSRFGALSPEQQASVDVPEPGDAAAWPELERDVLDASVDVGEEADALRWLRYERAAVSLGTAVLGARFPDADVVALRYRTRSQNVTPYSARHGSAEEREAARPTARERMSGWRDPLKPDVAEQDAIDGFDRRHR